MGRRPDFRWKDDTGARYTRRQITVFVGREELKLGYAMVINDRRVEAFPKSVDDTDGPVDLDVTIRQAIDRAVRFVEDFGLLGTEAWGEHLYREDDVELAESWVARVYGGEGEYL